MQRMTLGRDGPEVSAWCLGTMTWGTQTPAEEAHRQIETCLDAGIDFLDTAEMYPVNPISKELAGRSEEIIGDWVARTGRRNEIVIATKASGDGQMAVRDGEGFHGSNIAELVENSLKRLRTDVIDLYQLHWPQRGSYMFRQNWSYDPSGQHRAETLQHMDDVAGALGRMVEAGKIRAFGLSNESAWGTTRWIDRAEAVGGPRVVSVQNEYSLLCRLYDTDMAEMAVNEEVTLVSFSPLACGFLTGKYQGDAVPTGSRMDHVPQMGGRNSDRVRDAVAAYLGIAERHGLDPVHMALAWQGTRPFKVCPIFGATVQEQLERIIAGIGTRLADEVLAEIDEAHHAHPMPY